MGFEKLPAAPDRAGNAAVHVQTFSRIARRNRGPGVYHTITAILILVVLIGPHPRECTFDPDLLIAR